LFYLYNNGDFSGLLLGNKAFHIVVRNRISSVTKSNKKIFFEFCGNIITYLNTDVISFLLCVYVKCKFNIFNWFILMEYS